MSFGGYEVWLNLRSEKRFWQDLQKYNCVVSSRIVLVPDLITEAEEEQLGHIGRSS
jgi:hypothetical protein